LKTSFLLANKSEQLSTYVEDYDTIHKTFNVFEGLFWRLVR